MIEELNTRQKIILEAKNLVGLVGYQSFSFQHVADRLGIKKPSLFHHFESKEDLGIAILKEHIERVSSWSESIQGLDPEAKITAFFDFFIKVASDSNYYCPISSFSAELNTLPPSLRDLLEEMYDYRMNWLNKTIEEGQKSGVFKKELKAKELSSFIYSAVLGYQVMGRVKHKNNMKDLKKFGIQLILA